MKKSPNPFKDILLSKIKNKTALVGVIGLGYVGLPLAVEKALKGYQTIGFDVQKKKVEAINRGENYNRDIDNQDLAEVVASGKLKATDDYQFLQDVDIVSICVPTPLDQYLQPDMSYIKNSIKNVARFVHRGMLIILESTTYPGTTNEILKPVIEEKSKLQCGLDFFLAFSPERIDPGNPWYKVRNTPKVVGGVTPVCTEVAASYYQHIIDGKVISVSSAKIAEMEKIYENVFRYTNIALVNEMAILCQKMGIDFWEVIAAASTKPYGFMPFYPGPGVGGHCIPLDPFYLSWKAREYHHHTRLIELAGEINRGMPGYIIERVTKLLSQRLKKSLRDSKALLLGITYKRDVNDIRESPALEIIKKLTGEKVKVSYYDPYIEKVLIDDKEYYSLKNLNETEVKDQDIILITTDHHKVDYRMVIKNAKIVFDTRNAIKSHFENVEKL